jgi:hypothetical protein
MKEPQEIHEKQIFGDYYEILPNDPNRTVELSSHQYMIMASHIFAFMLKDRTYGESKRMNGT